MAKTFFDTKPNSECNLIYEIKLHFTILESTGKFKLSESFGSGMTNIGPHKQIFLDSHLGGTYAGKLSDLNTTLKFVEEIWNLIVKEPRIPVAFDLNITYENREPYAFKEEITTEQASKHWQTFKNELQEYIVPYINNSQFCSLF